MYLLKEPHFTIITPSYDLDFERCKLLSRSINYFIQPKVNHYIIVPQKDLALFRQLEANNTQILTIESIIPGWIQKIPGFRQGWFSLKTLPIRNWLMQQITKMLTARTIAQDIVIFIDSDVVFVRPYNLQSLIRDDGKIRLFRDPIGNPMQKEVHYKWHLSSAKLLGLSAIEPTIPDYIGQVITWKRDNLIQMCDRLEAISGRSWIEAVANSWHVSEYTLYGIFVDSFIDKDSSHYFDSTRICHDYWFSKSLSLEELDKFISQINCQQAAIMISSKANIPVEFYYPLLQKYFSEFRE